MSEFLIITPDSADWIQMVQPDADRLFSECISAQDVLTYSMSKDFYNLTLLLRDFGFFTLEQEVEDVRVLPTGIADSPYQFWYKLVNG